MSTQFHCPHCKGTIIAFGKDSPAATFEQSASGPDYPRSSRRSDQGGFWDSYGIRFTLAGLFAGLVVWLFTWLQGWSPLWAVMSAFLVGVGLHFLTVILYAPPRPPAPPKSKAVTIKVETWDPEEKHVILEQIRDDRISLEDLRQVARAILFNEANFSRPALTEVAGISQGKYHQIKNEFVRLNFAHKAPNNQYILSPRAMAFLRKVNDLPY